MENLEISQVLKQMADLLEIQEANPFRVRAYRNAARVVGEYPRPMREMVEAEADLTELPSIGKDLAASIRELVETGELAALEELGKDVPPRLLEVMRLPGVGPKKARKLWAELGVESVDDLEAAAEAGRVAELSGFGAKSQEKILTGIARFRRNVQRFGLAASDALIEPLLEHLRAVEGVERLEVAGSYRRRKETVGDIDLLAVAADAGPVMKALLDYPRVEAVDMAGETRSSVVLGSGLEVDLRVVPAESYGAALVYFTGSKEHNIKLRQRALERGLHMSEYGLFERGEEDDEEEREGRYREGRVAAPEEEDIYAAVDLPWILPTLREDRGEIEAAEKGELPEVVELDDIRGDLHMHSTWSDGKASIEDMLEACVARGYEYMAISDHSKALPMTGGLDAGKLALQLAQIETVRARHPEIRLLRSMEIDILADGSLDLEDEMIERLDLVLVAIHSRFQLPRRQQTKRLIRALEHPAVQVVGHPFGRRIGRRPPIDVDVDEILHCAKENGVAMELNAHPERLDLSDTNLIKARELGVKLIVSTDAHKPADLDLMRYGVEQAQRAWLTPEHVLNTQPLDAFLERVDRSWRS
jgi:DNA polymerase (family 10)